MDEHKYPTGKDKTKPVRLSEGLYDAVERSLRTEQARLLGFRFMSDVINAAVRDLLTKYKFLESLKESDEERPE